MEEVDVELKLSEMVFDRAAKEILHNQNVRIEALKIAAQIVVGLFRDKKYRNIDDVVDEMDAIYKISDINLKYIKGELDE